MNYSLINEAWDTLMTHDDNGNFIVKKDNNDDLLKNNTYNFKPIPNKNSYQSFVPTRNQNYNQENYRIIPSRETKNVKVKNDIDVENDVDLEDDVDEVENDTDLEHDEVENNAKNKKKNKKIVEKYTQEDKINELEKYVATLESKIQQIKINELNRNKSVFGDTNTNEMLIFLSMGIFTMMVLDVFVKLGQNKILP